MKERKQKENGRGEGLREWCLTELWTSFNKVQMQNHASCTVYMHVYITPTIGIQIYMGTVYSSISIQDERLQRPWGLTGNDFTLKTGTAALLLSLANGCVSMSHIFSPGEMRVKPISRHFYGVNGADYDHRA